MKPASFYTNTVSLAYYHCIQDLENHQEELEQFMDWDSSAQGMPPVISTTWLAAAYGNLIVTLSVVA